MAATSVLGSIFVVWLGLGPSSKVVLARWAITRDRKPAR